MKPKLKVDIKRKGATLTAQVIEQDEGLRGKDVISRREEFIIESYLHPAIDNKTLYIRGINRKMDNDIGRQIFDSEAEAIAAREAFLSMIAEINGESVKSEKPPQSSDNELRREEIAELKHGLPKKYMTEDEELRQKREDEFWREAVLISKMRNPSLMCDEADALLEEVKKRNRI